MHIDWNKVQINNVNFGHEFSPFKDLFVQGVGFAIRKALSPITKFSIPNYDFQILQKNKKIDCSQEFNYLCAVVMLTGHVYRKNAIEECIKLARLDLGEDHPTVKALAKLNDEIENNINRNSPDIELERRDLARKHNVCLNKS